MVKNVELKIDWEKANSLDLAARAEYFDNLAEQIAKYSENKENCVEVMAGNQKCLVLPEYKELFLTCYNEFDVSRVLAKKIEGKSLEEKMEYFNTLAKKIARMPKEDAVLVPYGKKSCTVDKKYASLFTAAYREFSKARLELKKLTAPTIIIDYDKARKLDAEKRADYFVSLLSKIIEVPLREDAEIVSIGRMSQKVNKNDISVFTECYNEFDKAKREFEKQVEKKLSDSKVISIRESQISKKSNQEKMNFYLDTLMSIVDSKKKKNPVERTLGSKTYFIDSTDAQAFDVAVNGYLEAKQLYKKELREMTVQHDYEVDKNIINSLSTEERRDYLEELVKKIIGREIFGPTEEVHRGKDSYVINKIDVKTFKYCVSSIYGIKHMLEAQRKASGDIIFTNVMEKNPIEFENLEDDDDKKKKQDDKVKKGKEKKK
ncbi:MAG: hypothetical protein OSJ70_09935, partial [Bacilli bacterium]|nr:hypothetical protein [Bacilli bacterium]